MPIPRSDQSSWPTHWPRPCQYQTHHIQWIPYTSIWCTPRTHHLATKSPWLSPPQGKNHIGMLQTPLVPPSWVYPQVRNLQLWRWTVPSLSDNPALILHLFPLQWPQTSLLQPLKQPSPSGPLMTWSRNSQISSKALANSPVNTKSDSIMMHILWYMLPENAPSPYVQRSKSTLTRWNT